MHLGARGFVHAELIDPETGAARRAGGRRRRASSCSRTSGTAPRRSLRFRTRDHVAGADERRAACGRTGPRVRCIGRTDDMLIVRGVNVFPSAVREVVSGFAPEVSGHILVRPQAPGVKQEPPLPVSVELARGRAAPTPRWRRRSARGCATCSSSRRASSSCRGEACSAASTSRSSSTTSRVRRRCRSSRARASTTSRSSAPTGRRRSTSGRACSACRSSSSSPTSTTSRESHLYFDPGDGRLITVFTNEEREPDPSRTPDRPGLRAPHRVLALAGDVRPGGGAARRARDPAQRRQGPRLHGLDLLRGPARAADRARVVPLRAAVRATRTPTCCSRRTSSASRAATTTSPRCTWRMRSRRSCARIARVALRRPRRPRIRT